MKKRVRTIGAVCVEKKTTTTKQPVQKNIALIVPVIIRIAQSMTMAQLAIVVFEKQDCVS
tara:strand:- start:498 stop:677 length:180 start_codon:yes stop_codon:yes gene_type:complete